MKRKICILTMGIGSSYGGLLQAYALQKILRNLGHEVLIENRCRNSTKFQRIFNAIKIFFVPIVGPLLRPITKIHYISKSTERKICKGTEDFRNKYIRCTEPIYSNTKEQLKKYKFDTYIVGSDQVWRRKYMHDPGSLFNNYLDFVEGEDVKRIAYAASFGVSEWEYSEEETEKCAKLLQKFDAVSTREDEGVEMCLNKFGVSAIQMIDPTLLLDKEVYEKIIEDEKVKAQPNELFYFILDPTEEKARIIDSVAEELKLKTHSIMPTKLYYNVGKKYIKDCVYHPVSEWLRCFKDAKFIVTDSFHGTVFSIIFNKPFISIANKDRGLSRFTTLLKIFSLENRLIFSKNDLTPELVHEKIDYSTINSIRAYKREEALNFLKTALK